MINRPTYSPYGTKTEIQPVFYQHIVPMGQREFHKNYFCQQKVPTGQKNNYINIFTDINS
jgi:hypothetical protein